MKQQVYPRRIVFNHAYVLKHDAQRTYIYSREKITSEGRVGINQSWMTKIHPVYAMLLALLSEPLVWEEAVKEWAYFLDINSEEAAAILQPFLDRDEPFYSKYDGVVSQFPKNVIIDADKSFVPMESYQVEEFAYTKINMEQERAIYAPRTVVFMPDNACTTSCIYCYADRFTHPRLMDFSRVQSIIEECRKLRIVSFAITGGDIFVYKYWRELLNCMRANRFSPGLLSTKTPVIDDQDVCFLKETGARIQFSLDTIEPNVCKNLLGMPPSYLEKVSHCFALFEQVGLKIQLATVLTPLNASVESIRKLYEYIKQFSCIDSWTLRTADKSLYSRKDFDTLRLSRKELGETDQVVKQLKAIEKVLNIFWDAENRKHYFQGTSGSKSFSGARCSANYSNIMILPDGKVTICEQLYWNPKYIIGDLTRQSIVEVWNSQHALELAFPKREKFRDVSPCKKCSLFDECYAYPNHCIVDVLKGYGVDNDDFPDPRCSRAPSFLTELRVGQND